MQPDVPEESSYVPAAQLEHALAAAPEKLPASQVEQLVDPVAAWKKPKAQDEQLDAAPVE